MIHIYDEEIYKHSDDICLSCEYDICEDCEYYNTNTTTKKEIDIKDGESNKVQ